MKKIVNGFCRTGGNWHLACGEADIATGNNDPTAGSYPSRPRSLESNYRHTEEQDSRQAWYIWPEPVETAQLA
jgi:hypothetical protein